MEKIAVVFDGTSYFLLPESEVDWNDHKVGGLFTSFDEAVEYCERENINVGI